MVSMHVVYNDSLHADSFRSSSLDTIQILCAVVCGKCASCMVPFGRLLLEYVTILSWPAKRDTYVHELEHVHAMRHMAGMPG